MKDYSKEIAKRFLEHENIQMSMNVFVNLQISRSNKKWCWFVIAQNIILIYLFYPSHNDVVKAARPLVDSVKVCYQKRLDFVVDSLSNIYYTNPPKSNGR